MSERTLDIQVVVVAACVLAGLPVAGADTLAVTLTPMTTTSLSHETTPSLGHDGLTPIPVCALRHWTPNNCSSNYMGVL
jgi:hypothetical protein